MDADLGHSVTCCVPIGYPPPKIDCGLVNLRNCGCDLAVGQFRAVISCAGAASGQIQRSIHHRHGGQILCFLWRRGAGVARQSEYMPSTRTDGEAHFMIPLAS